MSTPAVAYVAGGRLHLKAGDAPVRSFESAFAQQVRDRHVEIHQRHSWKSEGRGARFMSGLLWGGPSADPSQLRLAITSLTRGAAPGELLYALDTEGRTAVCLFRTGDASERRLLHGSPYAIRDLRAAPGGGRIACSVLHPDGTSSIGIMSPDATDLIEITEGDVQDRFPCFEPAGRRIAYQSAGIGRSAAGHVTGLGRTEVHLLDLDDGALETLASDPGHDLLCPQLGEDDTLYCLRRPRQGGRAATVGSVLLDLVLLPPRLLYAVFQYLNFFTARYTGKPLTTAGGPKRQGADMRQMMVWSNLMQAGSGDGEEPEPAVPRDWELVRMAGRARPEVVASGVLAFDLGPDGSVVYSTGSAIHHVSPEGRHQRLLSGERVEALVCLPWGPA